MRLFKVVVVLLVLVVFSGGRLALAENKPAPLDRAELDRRAAAVAYDACVLGTQIYNKGNHEGCYRIYQATLMALRPLLDHRPKLAERIQEGLEKVKLVPTAIEASFVLRQTLDALQKELAGPAGPAVNPALKKPDDQKETLWDRLGGEKAVRAVVHDFVANALIDPSVGFTRGGKFPIDARGVVRLEQHLVEWISSASGGPLKYMGRGMKEAHKGMKITEAEFNACVADLAASLKKFKVADAAIEELLAAVAGTKAEVVEGK